jgi:hypothetical protein
VTIPRLAASAQSGDHSTQFTSPIAKTVLTLEVIVRHIVSLVAAMSAVIVLAAPAHADSDDDVFLKAIYAHGLTNSGGDQQFIKLGHMTCDLLGQGYSLNALASMTQLHGNSMSADDSKFLVQTSAAAYCPQYIN